MKKQRFRDIKNHKTPIKKPIKENNHYASASAKIKAFLTDAFMLIMPITYVVIYFIMDGREGFAAEKILGWLYILYPLIAIQSIFLFLTGQTPGYRAYNLTLIDENTKEKPTLFIVIFRNLSAILSFFTFAWMLMFFRKDSKTLHDLLSATAVIYKK
ncbi:MAG: RDD family protein [Epsilonproteobacteria bacterium]|nr:MAG: RDD family protein [Campylobacterota bacterium]